MKYSITGFDIGTEEIKVCVLEIDTKERTEKVVGFFKYKIDGMRKGYVSNESVFTQSLKRICIDLQKTLGSKIETVAISIGSASLESMIVNQNSIVTKADNEITRFDIETIEKNIEDGIVHKTKKILYGNIIEYKVDGKTLITNPEGQKGVKLDIKKIFIQMLASHFDTFENAFFESRIEIGAVYPKGICASMIGLTEKQKMVGVGYLDIGAETTAFAVYENNILIGYTLIPVGSNDITNDIALGLKISLEEAELVKRGMANKLYPRKKLDDIISSRLEDISELANMYLKKIKKYELLPGGIILNGGGSEITAIEDYFRTSMNLPIKKMLFEIQTDKKGVVRDSDFLESYGVAHLYTKKDLKETRKQHSKTMDKIKSAGSTFLKQFLP